MARHRTAQEKHELGERASALRAAGRSRREVQAELGIGDDLAKALLHGVPLPERGKTDERETARALRSSGCTYDQIAAELGISKSTCSRWLRDPAPAPVVPAGPRPGATGGRAAEARRLRSDGVLLRDIAARLGVSAKTAYYWTWDLPVPPSPRTGGDPAHMQMMRRRYWDRVLAEREDERQQVRAQHAARTGHLDERELEIAAVVAYWCEGSKSKPYARREQVTFINSDPGLVLLFLAWLDRVRFPAEERVFSLSIHESADVTSAERWWADVVGVPVEQFRPASLKRHNPRTVRLNTEQAYAGCLVVRLRQCRTLYQRIEGVWQGIMSGLPRPGEEESRVV